MCLKHLCTGSNWYLKIVERVEYNIQTFPSVLARKKIFFFSKITAFLDLEISKSKNAVILIKKRFFSLQKERCTSSICV